jgi:hypothetical protein
MEGAHELPHALQQGHVALVCCELGVGHSQAGMADWES